MPQTRSAAFETFKHTVTEGQALRTALAQASAAQRAAGSELRAAALQVWFCAI